MEYTADIEHIGLDTDDDDDDDRDVTSCFGAVITPDGMRYSGSVGCEGAADPETVAHMLLTAAESAARLHSPEAGQYLAARLRPRL